MFLQVHFIFSTSQNMVQNFWPVQHKKMKSQCSKFLSDFIFVANIFENLLKHIQKELNLHLCWNVNLGDHEIAGQTFECSFDKYDV